MADSAGSSARSAPLANAAQPPLAPARVAIDTLRLNLVGHDAAAGHRIATAVAERLSRALPDVSPVELASLELKLELPQRASEAAVVEAVTAAIRRALARTGGR